MILLVLVGPPVERQLGTLRFLLLTLIAIATTGIVRLVTGIDFNGASAIIWAYAPLLWWLIRQKKSTDQAAILWVMWLIVPLTMGILLMLNGTPLLKAVFWGNIYHIAGTIVGFFFIWLWRRYLA